MKLAVVDQYILKKGQWTAELELLRDTMLAVKMEETLKWGTPVYTNQGKNILGLAAFKSYVGIWFFNGSVLKDKEQKLFNAQEGKPTAIRQWRFSSIDEIIDNLEIVEKYVHEAIQIEVQGKTVKPIRNKPLIIPLELQEKLSENAELKRCFDALNLTMKREFCRHIESAKRMETKQNRLNKVIPMIFDGISIHEKYRK